MSTKSLMGKQSETSGGRSTAAPSGSTTGTICKTQSTTLSRANDQPRAQARGFPRLRSGLVNPKMHKILLSHSSALFPCKRRRRLSQILRNHPLPAIYRYDLGGEGEPAGQGEFARDPQSALVEAALLAADEPLPGRKLAAVADLTDAAAARRLIRKLQNLYAKEGTAFQIEELAGGYQLLTRPEFHRWLVRLRRTSQD